MITLIQYLSETLNFKLWLTKKNYSIVIINVGQKITITTINFKFLFLENYLYDSSDAQLWDLNGIKMPKLNFDFKQSKLFCLLPIEKNSFKLLNYSSN